MFGVGSTLLAAGRRPAWGGAYELSMNRWICVTVLASAAADSPSTWRRAITMACQDVHHGVCAGLHVLLLHAMWVMQGSRKRSS
jgi:hypothetical protein